MRKRSKMSRDARRFAALQQLHTVPVTPVTRHDTDYASFIAREEREQRERAEAPLKKIVAETQSEVTRTLSEHSARVAKFWRLPIASIEDYCRHDDEVVDNRLDLPTTKTPLTNEEFTITLKTFVENLPVRGVELLTQDAKRRFALYACSQRDSRGAVLDDTTLTAMLERCMSLDIFGDAVTGQLAKATPKQTEGLESSTPTWDTVEGLSTEDRDQRKQVLQAVNEDFTSEVAAFFGLWQEQLRRDYSYVMPEAVIKRALQYVTDQNMNPLRHETWNIVRRVFTKNGWFPAGMLTEREKLTELADRSDLNDREVRRQINLKNREILESEPAFAPHK
jgi:hypothetical protein